MALVGIVALVPYMVLQLKGLGIIVATASYGAISPTLAIWIGAAVLTVSNLGDRWVRIYIAEAKIGAVQLGQPATITTDTYADRRYDGQVAFIASQAEFTPRNVQTQAERVKLVYAVKVRVMSDTANALKPGMPADVLLKSK